MKRVLTLAILGVSALSLVNCASEPVHVHHYHTNTRYVSTPTYRYTKPAGVSGGYSSGSSYTAPESFSAVTPPSSYSQ